MPLPALDGIDADAVDLDRAARQYVRGHQFAPALTADFHPIPLLYYAKFRAPMKFRGALRLIGWHSKMGDVSVQETTKPSFELRKNVDLCQS